MHTTFSLTGILTLPHSALFHVLEIEDMAQASWIEAFASERNTNFNVPHLTKNTTSHQFGTLLKNLNNLDNTFAIVAWIIKQRIITQLHAKSWIPVC